MTSAPGDPTLVYRCEYTLHAQNLKIVTRACTEMLLCARGSQINTFLQCFEFDDAAFKKKYNHKAGVVPGVDD